jgi:hypothetical protein
MRQRIFSLCIALQDYPKKAVATDDVVNQFCALSSLDEKWRNHPGKNDDV